MLPKSGRSRQKDHTQDERAFYPVWKKKNGKGDDRSPFQRSLTGWVEEVFAPGALEEVMVLVELAVLAAVVVWVLVVEVMMVLVVELVSAALVFAVRVVVVSEV